MSCVIDLVASFALLGLLVLMCGGYTVRSALVGRLMQKRLESEGKLLGTTLLEGVYWLMTPPLNLLHAIGATPNMITLGSLIPGIGGGVALATGHFGLAGLCGTLVGLLDILDGQLARRLGISSDAGEVFDAAVDRYTEFAALAGLTIYWRAHWPLMVMALLALLGSLMISYSSAKAEALHLPSPKGIMRRAERAVFINSGAVFTPVVALFLPPHLHARLELREAPMLLFVGLVAVLANVSAVRRFAYLVRGAREKAAASRTPPTSFTSPSPTPGSAHAV
jgi:CDP-diacylglycerol--glycerol-3-phosphate 3-phosphatidyltransferase